MILTSHFTLDEMVASETAARRGIDNTPNASVLANLRQLAKGLECVRNILGAPITITSGFRSLALNRAVGSKDTSAHVQGWAADFIAPRFGKPIDIVRAIASSAVMFDQCIQEGTWVHISFDPRARHQLLTAHFGPGGVTYTAGV